MNPIILINKEHANRDPQPLLYACGQCGVVWSPKMFVAPDEKAQEAAFDLAERCCKVVLCDCGEPVMKHRTACAACIQKEHLVREQNRIDKATQYTVATCPPNTPLLYNDDDYHYDLDSLLERLTDDDVEDECFPLVAWLCEKKTPQLDIDHIREAFEESLELGENCELDSVTVDFDEFVEFVAKWNAKQEAKLWMPTTNQCVLIQRADVPKDEES